MPSLTSAVSAMLGVSCLLGTASADSTNDLLGPREIAVGEAMRGGATGASAISMNPAGLPLNRELVFEGGYGWRGSDDATLIGVSACDSTNAAPGCFFYDYLGTNPELAGGMSGARRTHVGGMALSRQLLPRVMVGATMKYFSFKSDMAGETSESGFTADFGATLRMTQMINIGLAAQNLYQGEESPMFPRTLGAGLHARPMPNLSIGFDARWLSDVDDVGKSIRYGGGAELFLSGSRGQSGYPLRLGALRDDGVGSTYVSGGLGMATLKWSIDIAARREVKGGDETMVLASMRFWGPREASPSIDQPID
ncbi:MAG TPA: hypothetical protein VK427_10235 [Kofleriaceae bacterium]|nr:hypothetical protein [Kofleriaceae bacterium]